MLDRRPPWVRWVVGDVLAAYHRPPADRPRELTRLIELSIAALPAVEGDPGPPRVRRWLVPELAMGPRRWPVPEIPTVGELAEFLGVSDGELAWMADARGYERRVREERLRNYRYRTLARRAGRMRVIEHPKQRLKAIQRRILHDILDQIPAHEAAHGFMRGRSVASHARHHTGRFVVVGLDLEDFFSSIGAARVFGLFRTAGYPESVAHALAALVTNVVPAAVWQAIPRPADPSQISAHHRLGRRLAAPHLPQRAPTSSALANLAVFRLDRRVAGLAASLGLTYTRYADDLTFSGPRGVVHRAATLRRAVAQIAREEGFAVNEQKARLATRAGRQRVCGIVVNERVNVARDEFDVLKAILHNCAVHGPASQNRQGVADFRSHLLGRISWVGSLHDARGQRLRHQFAAIDWRGTQP